MMAADEDALLCDMAETYGVFNLRALPVKVLAALACGLRENSRIRMRLSGSRLTLTETLLAGMVDRLAMLVWLSTEDGREGVNRPCSILDILTGEGESPSGDVRGFDSAEGFEAEWERITGVGHGR